jgi:F-type H+-transporting ATPase subunit epsilon
MNKIRLEIISPEKTLADLEVEMIMIPGREGDFGALYGHENVIATVRPGVVEVYQGSNIADRFVVSSGSVEITGKLCTILVDEAVKVGEIEFSYIERRLSEAKRSFDKETIEITRTNLTNEIKYLEEIMKFKA